MYSEEMELDPVADRDPISDPGPREHFVKCRITRNRKGVDKGNHKFYHMMHYNSNKSKDLQRCVP